MSDGATFFDFVVAAWADVCCATGALAGADFFATDFLGAGLFPSTTNGGS